MLTPGKESYEQHRWHIKKQRHYFANKGLSSLGCGFSSSHLWMGDWTIKKVEYWRIEAFELWCWKRLLRVPWTAEIQPVHPKGNQSWIFIGRTDAATVRNWLFRKNPDAGKDWGQEEKGMTEDEMVGWHHWLSGYEFEQTLGDCKGRECLAWCSPWRCKELNRTEQLNNNNKKNLPTQLQKRMK